MTEYEQEMVEAVNEALDQARQLGPEIFGDEVSPEFLTIVTGSMMAAVDAIFAIRDGRSWRNMDDPRDIAQELIRTAHLTE